MSEPESITALPGKFKDRRELEAFVTRFNDLYELQGFMEQFSLENKFSEEPVTRDVLATFANAIDRLTREIISPNSKEHE